MSLTIALCATLGAYSILLRLGVDQFTQEARRQLAQPASEQIAQLSIERDRQRIGQATGTGDAIMQAEGRLPMLAMKANQNQPFLSRDPEGFGEVGNDPSESVLPQGTVPAPAPMVDSPEAPFGLSSAALSAPSVKPKTAPRVIGPEAKSSEINEARERAQIASTGVPVAPAPSAQPYLQTSPAPSADPAPMSDSEIDAFSKTGGVDFRPGKTTVQFGRKVKLTRPKMTISGQFDLFSLRSPRVVLEIRTDASGDVYDVQLLRTSGSNDLDLACQHAAYNWWFEPPKDPTGKPRADIFPFTIAFH